MTLDEKRPGQEAQEPDSDVSEPPDPFGVREEYYERIARALGLSPERLLELFGLESKKDGA